jgi:hypothetical protein
MILRALMRAAALLVALVARAKLKKPGVPHLVPRRGVVASRLC